MATDSLPPQLPTAATPPLPELPIQQVAGVNPSMVATGIPAGVATDPLSLQAQVAGVLPMTGAAAVVTSAPPLNWCLPPIGASPGAASANQGAPPSAGLAASIGVGLPTHNWSLPFSGIRPGPAATPALEGASPSASAGAAATATAPSNRLQSLPAQDWSLGVRPAAAPGSGATKWSLPSKILQAAKLQPQDGCIWRLESAAMPPGMCTPMVVFLGPLFPLLEQRQMMEETKWAYVHNLILRAHSKEEAGQKLTAYLTRIDSMEPKIRQRYDPSECRVTRNELVEMMVLDGLFIIEVLLNHWMGKIEKGSASPRVQAETGNSDHRAPLASTLVPQVLREEFTPLKVRWEPHALRFDLIVVPNQIPFFVLEELFQMTEVPELRELQQQPTKLREIILDYLVGDVGDGVLAGYDGPVHHILHLVYLHLTFSKEESRVSALQPGAPVPRPSLLDRALDKLKKKRMDLRALCKRTFSRSSDLPVGWKQWKLVPPLRELVRVGVKLKRTETYRFADVRFKDGRLEIPAFAWRRYHIRLLTNLVVLEMSGWWPREKRLFCSYVMFMSELIMKKEDAALLFKKGIVQENNMDDVEKSFICPILILADFSHGSQYESRFSSLVCDVFKCYQRWSKVGVAPSSRSTK
ncbi:uncharacterized protein LOC120713712 [Panicum virgatum]|uniref:Uncharacterized protein n=1 Tax=Panicum virgatum TaxID=38727 RepID=A0A8T0RI63_PANVG|nr:uncharacterized protein LOC120713712 [Panicum virgatum]KAG2584788.1 hypothetical protein PVAP13_6KG343000 [Panicum virgatum]